MRPLLDRSAPFTPEESADAEWWITWTDASGERESRVSGEAEAVQEWNALHELTAESPHAVNHLRMWEVVGGERRQRGQFSHRFAELLPVTAPDAVHFDPDAG